MNAISAASGGVSAAMAWFDASTAQAARTGLPGTTGENADVVGAVTDQVAASAAVEVNVAMLRTALDTQASLIDVLA